jgi:hypothetical protein
MPLAFCSYQTTHGTVSFLPVNAKSGSTPSRVGSMFSGVSPVSDDASAPGAKRLTPVCCQQNVLTLVPPPGWLRWQSVCLMAREAKIWFFAASEDRRRDAPAAERRRHEASGEVEVRVLLHSPRTPVPARPSPP